jgi:hypothetical protein
MISINKVLVFLIGEKGLYDKRYSYPAGGVRYVKKGQAKDEQQDRDS